MAITIGHDLALVFKVGRCLDCPFFFGHHSPGIGVGCKVDDALFEFSEEAEESTWARVHTKCPLRRFSVRVEIETTESEE